MTGKFTFSAMARLTLLSDNVLLTSNNVCKRYIGCSEWAAYMLFVGYPLGMDSV